MPTTIPTTKHYALIEFDERHIHHEADERSRTYPGHGYPAYTETIETISYKVFMTIEELQKEVELRQKFYKNSVKNYVVMEVQPLKIKTTVSVEIS